MEKLTQVIEIGITPGPATCWLEEQVISEDGVIIARQLTRKFLIIGDPIPENTPAIVIAVIEALANLDWPVTPGNPMP
jgi:hypothetical protein